MIRIAIGTGKNLNIFDAIKIFEKNHHAEIILIDNDDDLAKPILNSDIDAVVRGSLPASGVIKKAWIVL